MKIAISSRVKSKLVMSMMFVSMFAYGNFSYATTSDLVITPPVKITCHDGFCDDVNEQYFSIISKTEGVLIFQFGAAIEAVSGYRIIYQYWQPETGKITLLEMKRPKEYVLMPYRPGSAWENKPAGSQLFCYGTAPQCSATYSSSQ